MNDLHTRAAKIQMILMDVDGVLTDGSFWWGPNGEEWKRFHFAEGTVEEQIAARVVGRMAVMDGMAGDDTAELDDIARIIDELAAERNT